MVWVGSQRLPNEPPGLCGWPLHGCRVSDGCPPRANLTNSALQVCGRKHLATAVVKPLKHDFGCKCPQAPAQRCQWPMQVQTIRGRPFMLTRSRTWGRGSNPERSVATRSGAVPGFMPAQPREALAVVPAGGAPQRSKHNRVHATRRRTCMCTKYATVTSDLCDCRRRGNKLFKSKCTMQWHLGMLRNLPKQHLPRYGLLQ
jgi:hypothetical protein